MTPTLAINVIPYPIDDPHVSERHDDVVIELRALERLAAEYYGADAGHERKRTSGLDRANPATRRLIEVAAFDRWLAQIPTAAALHPLYQPDSKTYVDGHPIDDLSREWFRNTADARGIRSRARVMGEVLAEDARAGRPGQRWLSLASGAAQPILATLERLATELDAPPAAVLADLDVSALQLVEKYAAEHGLTNVTTIRANVLNVDGLDRILGRLPFLRRASGWQGAFDAVDAVGLLEYLRADDWTYTYRGVIKSRKRLAGAVTFLSNAYDCVRPGGLLILGNMLRSHPQLGFTMDVVQWPHIQPRSVDEMVEIFHAAGLRGSLDVYLPDDGVYAVYVVRKPN